MRPIQRSQREALAVFSEDSNYRRAAWQEYLRKLREARARQSVRQQQREQADKPVIVGNPHICQSEGERAGVSHG